LKDTKTDDARFLAQWTTEEENALREGVKRCVCVCARARARAWIVASAMWKR